MNTKTYAAGTIRIAHLDKRYALPISGDATTRHRAETIYPYTPIVNIWRGRNVIPARKTYGITVGSTIRTAHGPIEVTRVGSLAGWGIRNHREVRWEAQNVLEVIPA